MSEIVIKINREGLRFGCLAAAFNVVLLFVDGLIFKFEPAGSYIVSIFVVSILIGGLITVLHSIE